METADMILDVMALVAVLFLGLGLGGVAVAVFLYAIEKMQNGGKK
jgi:Flp pilus assembly protein TadG